MYAKRNQSGTYWIVDDLELKKDLAFGSFFEFAIFELVPSLFTVTYAD